MYKKISWLTAILILLLCVLPLHGLSQGKTAEDSIQSVIWSEQTAGENRVIYPVLTGLEDEEIQNAVNQEIFQTLHVDDLLARLERTDAQTQSLLMEGQATLRGQVFSASVRIKGEQYDGSFGDRMVCLNYDLSTGEAIPLEALFSDANAALERMSRLAQEQILPELSAYLENDDVLPLPEDSFFLSERGIVFYYPQERFSMISGNVGACAFDYYEVADLLDGENPLFEALFAPVLTAHENAAEAIENAVREGRMPGIPFQVGKRAGEYIQAYTLLNDPDYTLTSLVYQFEDAALRGSGMETWLYDEAEEAQRLVTAVRSSRIDFYGVRPGITTLKECTALLGEAQERVSYDAEQAMDMLLTPGESLFYRFGENELEVHADEQGVVSCLMIRAVAE